MSIPSQVLKLNFWIFGGVADIRLIENSSTQSPTHILVAGLADLTDTLLSKIRRSLFYDGKGLKRSRRSNNQYVGILVPSLMSVVRRDAGAYIPENLTA